LPVDAWSYLTTAGYFSNFGLKYLQKGLYFVPTDGFVSNCLIYPQSFHNKNQLQIFSL